MGYRHDREGVLGSALALAHESGLKELTFRSVGQRAGIPDRTVVYYFPTKDQLILAVLQRTTAQLMDLLATAVGEETRQVGELLQTSWDALRRPEADRGLRLYIETVGLAAHGREPYRSVITDLTATWTTWFATRLALEPGRRDDHAAAIVATLDGLLLLQATAGTEVADAAARGLGLTA
ncbi:MAG TPA: TetR/AcrR family transcriptional regulator [Kineosporiaceae bacterium]|nr:TetR/AcrR family transcriptional regulator [Kineosporiaceae bacterium]